MASIGSIPIATRNTHHKTKNPKIGAIATAIKYPANRINPMAKPVAAASTTGPMVEGSDSRRFV